MHWWQRVSAGHLHLDRFESTFHNAHTSKKHHPFGWCFLLAGLAEMDLRNMIEGRIKRKKFKE